MTTTPVSLPSRPIVATAPTMDPFSAGGLSPETLYFYLQSRLEGLDQNINATFDRQQKSEQIRKQLMAISDVLQDLDDVKGSTKENSNTDFEPRIHEALDNLKQIKPEGERLATEMEADLGKEGQILDGEGGKGTAGAYAANEVTGSREYISNKIKELESGSQLEMIQLQSYMSARTTAIQLATNMVNALGEGPKAIAGNIGR